jgi:phosphatidylinositol 4-kinase
VPLEGTIIDAFSPTEQIFHEHEFALIDKLADISQFLLPLPIDERPKHLVNKLLEMTISNDLYVPSNPNYHIMQINASQSRPLKSHSRVPILVSFTVHDEGDANSNSFRFSCIFKIHDDVRMDAMMIQFIDKFQRIFQEVGLSTYMNAYRVFATGEGRGVIQCIQNAKSRHELGMEKNEDLSSYFARTYGPPWSNSFIRAQSNFVASMAPYSLLCYIFQVKDRHNANIMIDADGHVLHIDFGFIFDISPGNIRFEANSFKLTTEMIQVMGGKDGQAFKEFCQLFTQCFIAARARYPEIEPIAYLMKDAGFPCFKGGESFKRLQQRFFMDRSDAEVPELIDALIIDAYKAIGTTGYDMFQQRQNRIFYV